MFFWQRLQGTTFVVIARLFFEKFEISENKACSSNKADIVLQVKRVLMVSRFFLRLRLKLFRCSDFLYHLLNCQTRSGFLR